MEEDIPMNKVLCCIVQSGVLVAGLVCGAEAFAQEGNESSRLVQRIESYPANAPPACRAGRHATAGRAETH